MLVIREEQLAAFAASRRNAFDAQCVALLRTTWADDHQALNDEQLRALVKERLGRAHAFGFTTERELYRFLNLSALLGHDFEWHPENEWIVTLLQDPAIPFTSKFDIIVSRRGAAV